MGRKKKERSLGLNPFPSLISITMINSSSHSSKLATLPFENQFLNWCPCFSWSRISFLPSSSYGAVFWIQDMNNADNTPMLQLLLNSAQYFLASYTARKELEVQKESGQLIQNDQRDIPHHMALCSARGGRLFEVILFVFTINCYA